MTFEVIAGSGKRKLQLTFIRWTDKRPKVRFTNYDKYDRREALETFLDASYFRHALNKEQDMQKPENDPLTTQFLIANDNSYGRAMDEAMKTFVTRKQELSNVDFRSQTSTNPEFLEKTQILRLCFSKITITLTKEIREHENLVVSERELLITMGSL